MVPGSGRGAVDQCRRNRSGIEQDEFSLADQNVARASITGAGVSGSFSRFLNTIDAEVPGEKPIHIRSVAVLNWRVQLIDATPSNLAR